jgi:hypothetical protein
MQALRIRKEDHSTPGYGRVGVDDAGAWRHVALGNGEHEITHWYWGDEEARRIVRDQRPPAHRLSIAASARSR